MLKTEHLCFAYADGRVVYNGEPQTFLASMYRDGRDVSHHTDDGGAK